jgi:acyl-CoA synthetase (AMP-forming)/AMP-acid ligase II
MSVTTESAVNAASSIVDQHVTGNEGDRLAFRFRDKRYSYYDLAALTNRAGNLIKRHNVNPGDCVLVAAAPSPALVATVLGAMKIGCYAVLVSASTGGERLRQIIESLEPKLLVLESSRASDYASFTARIPTVVIGDAPAGYKSFIEEMRSSPSSLAKRLVGNESPAIAIATSNDILTFSHEQIAGALSGSPIVLKYDQWDLGSALAQFGRSGEAAIG